MTNEKINSTVEEIMEYEALLDEVKGIVDGLKDNLKNEMAERKVESLSTDRYTVRWTEVLTSKFNSKEFKKVYENLYTAFLRQTRLPFIINTDLHYIFFYQMGKILLFLKDHRLEYYKRQVSP